MTMVFNISSKGVCHDIFGLHIFHDSNPSRPLINRLKSVWISPRYSITKFEKFSLSNKKKFSSNLFFYDRIVYPKKEFSYLSLEKQQETPKDLDFDSKVCIPPWSFTPR